MSDQMVKLKMAAATDRYLALGVDDGTTEDADNRFELQANGQLMWGDGTSAQDVILKRNGAGVLDLSTGSLAIGGTTLTATPAEINRIATGSAKVVNATGTTLAVTQALHANRIITLNRAAGIAVTLPAATGTGDTYKFIVGTTFTGAASIAVPNATDYMIGTANMGIDGGTSVPHLYPTANTGTVSTESDTINLLGTSNSTGGIKGELIELIDIAAAVWFVRIVGDAAGTEATPFSAAV